MQEILSVFDSKLIASFKSRRLKDIVRSKGLGGCFPELFDFLEEIMTSFDINTCRIERE